MSILPTPLSYGQGNVWWWIAVATPTQTALQLLEKSVHEKQDSVIALRKQLEELKAANLKIQNQLKVKLLDAPSPPIPRSN